jgi:hypothetical protein
VEQEEGIVTRATQAATLQLNPASEGMQPAWHVEQGAWHKGWVMEGALLVMMGVGAWLSKEEWKQLLRVD